MLEKKLSEMEEELKVMEKFYCFLHTYFPILWEQVKFLTFQTSFDGELEGKISTLIKQNEAVDRCFQHPIESFYYPDK